MVTGTRAGSRMKIKKEKEKEHMTTLNTRTVHTQKQSYRLWWVVAWYIKMNAKITPLKYCRHWVKTTAPEIWTMRRYQNQIIRNSFNSNIVKYRSPITSISVILSFHNVQWTRQLYLSDISERFDNEKKNKFMDVRIRRLFGGIS